MWLIVLCCLIGVVVLGVVVFGWLFVLFGFGVLVVYFVVEMVKWLYFVGGVFV